MGHLGCWGKAAVELPGSSTDNCNGPTRSPHMVHHYPLLCAGFSFKGFTLWSAPAKDEAECEMLGEGRRVAPPVRQRCGCDLLLCGCGGLFLQWEGCVGDMGAPYAGLEDAPHPHMLGTRCCVSCLGADSTPPSQAGLGNLHLRNN